MSLNPYLRPQSTITQILRMTASPAATRINPVVIGPQYKLVLNDGRDLPEYAFATAGDADLPYNESIGGVSTPLDPVLFLPEQSSVKLFGRGLLAAVSATVSCELKEEGSGYATIRYEGTEDNLADFNTVPDLVAGLRSRSIRVGDQVSAVPVYGVTNGATVWRTVTALLPRMSASVLPEAAVAYNSAYDAAAAKLTVAVDEDAYTGPIDTRYIFEVVSGTSVTTAVIRVWDSSGTEPVQILTGSVGTPLATSNVVIGTYGLKVGFAADIVLVPGAKFYIAATSSKPSATEFDGVRLDGPVSNGEAVASVTLVVHQRYTGEITSENLAGIGDAVTAASGGVTYAASLGLRADVTGATLFSAFADGQGTVVVSFKAVRLPGAVEAPIAITSSEQLVELLGETGPENWLARGAFEAFTGNQGRKVYALRTSGDTVDAFAAALNKIRSTDVYYALVPLTDDLDVMKLVTAHAESMSDKYKRNFRRCYVGTDSPGEYTVWGQNTDGTYRIAGLDGRIVTVDAAFRATSDFTANASVGDLIKFNSLDVSYPILAVLSAYEVLIDCSNGLDLPADGFKLIRANTPANTVRFLQERAAALSSRRCTNVWCDNGYYQGADGNTLLPNKFLAAEVAGLRCALLPQQGLTMTEISAITSAPTMYTTFTPEQLDDVSAAGNLVITQESLGGEVFIRHQLTTDISHGALAYEDNVGVIVDVLSYREKDAFRNYIGKRNVTQDTITDVRTELTNLAVDATQVEARFAEFGPLAIRFFDENGKEGAVTVRVDGDLADRILTYVKYRVALPLNGLDNFIDVESSVEL